tara:strand:+ start:187 stop:567 length:381 start_codon:yes stop_codon:yes gene_type:complete
MKYLILITCISLGVIIFSWLRNNKKDHFLIRLKAWLSGDSWNYPNALIEWPSDFELIRRSRIRRSRKGNVIPFPTKNKNEERLISNIKRMAKERETLPEEERKKSNIDIQRCTRIPLMIQIFPPYD